MSLRLRIEHGQDEGKTFRLPGPGVYTIGRKTDVSLRVLDMKVSGYHCEIRIAGAGDAASAVLHDPGSTHGSLLNGQPVRKDRALNPGDEVRLGMTIIRILSDGPADEDIQPAANRAVDAAAMSAVAKGGGNSGETKQTLPPDALVGKELGGYQVDRKIGMGGMGGVYLAEQVSLKRKVALKVLNETFASDSAFVDQFVNEARAAGALNHPNVVQVYDVGSANGHYYFSMEVMPGGSIEDKLREGAVDWKTGLNWFIDAANALIFAKRREILHRDVKPDNLMIGEDDSAKLCDLGLAKKSETSDFMDQGIIGTPHFISPESIRRKTDIDHRTDLYSLGCSFYRIFTGKNPYPGTTVKEILLGHLKKPTPRVSARNRDIPKEIDDVVFQLMAKDASERIQTPEELLRILDKTRTTYNLEAHGIKPASKKPLLIGAAAALIAISAAIYIIATTHNTVTVADRTPEQLAADAQAKRVIKASELSTTALSENYYKLAKELNDLRLRDGDNWKKAAGPRISKSLKALANTWTTKAVAWQTERNEESEVDMLGLYDAAIEKVRKFTADASRDAKGVDTYIAEVKKNAAQYKTKRTEALASIDETIRTYVQELKALQLEGAFLELEKSLHEDEVLERLKPLRSLKVGSRFLLTDEDIRTRLDKQLPGTKDGKERGKKSVTAAIQMIEKNAEAKLGEALLLVSASPGHTEYAKALVLLKEHIDALPDEEPFRKTAPRTSSTYTRVRKGAKELRSTILADDEKMGFAQVAHDKQIYFTLGKVLWGAREDGGLLQRFDFVSAKANAERTVKQSQDARYRALAQSWLPSIAALQGTFKRMISAFPAGWSNDVLYVVDGKGKRKKRKIKAISSDGVTVGKEKRSFAELGPQWLLENLFFSEGAPRLKTCSGEDHFGLAVLAEMAGHYDLAATQYKQAEAGYGAGGKPSPADLASMKAIRARVEGDVLDLERQAAEKWARVRDWWVQTETEVGTYLAMVAAQEYDPKAFLQPAREASHTLGTNALREMQAMQAMYAELRKRKDLAGTRWGSALRSAPHPDVAYAGETLPSIKTGGTRKPGGEKSGKKSGEDK